MHSAAVVTKPLLRNNGMAQDHGVTKARKLLQSKPDLNMKKESPIKERRQESVARQYRMKEKYPEPGDRRRCIMDAHIWQV